MSPASMNSLQLIPPAIVLLLLGFASYFFWTRYVKRSRLLCAELERIGATVRTMADGEESMRRTGVDRVFQGTEMQPLWREFTKTFHTQIKYVNGVAQSGRTRLTMPASTFFSAASVIDRPLSVEYFKHLPGILTGIGIIGTFSGLLFGLSNFDATDAESMSRSVSLLLSGVRDAFYASAAAIAAAMIITHWEKWLYRRCLCALDVLVDAINGLFESGVGEEYLSELVANSHQAAEQMRNARDDLLQAMMPMIRQMENLQTQQLEGLSQSLETALTEANRKLALQLEGALTRQVRLPLEEMSKNLDARLMPQSQNTLAMKVIRAKQSETVAETKSELS